MAVELGVVRVRGAGPDLSIRVGRSLTELGLLARVEGGTGVVEMGRLGARGGTAGGDTETAARLSHRRYVRLSRRDREFADSPLEGDGFELPVPRHSDLCDRDGSHQTHCWREPDSNSRSRERRPASSPVFVHFRADYFSWRKSVEAESGGLATLVVSRGTESLKPVPSAAESVSPTLSAAACKETLPLRPSVACEEIKRDFVHFSAQHHVLTCQRSQAADP
jgi:hypothetical protein